MTGPRSEGDTSCPTCRAAVFQSSGARALPLIPAWPLPSRKVSSRLQFDSEARSRISLPTTSLCHPLPQLPLRAHPHPSRCQDALEELVVGGGEGD